MAGPQPSTRLKWVIRLLLRRRGAVSHGCRRFRWSQVNQSGNGGVCHVGGAQRIAPC